MRNVAKGFVLAVTLAMCGLAPAWAGFLDTARDRGEALIRGLAPAAAPKGMTVEVGFSPDGDGETLVLRAIGAAHSSIRLAGYTFSSPTIVRALIDARKRGVDVAVVVDGLTVETGSFNYTSAAAKRNSENVLVIWNDGPLAGRYITHWQSRWEQGQQYVPGY